MKKFRFVIASIMLVPAFSIAATQRIVTVKSFGGDYTSLAAAVAGESKNLVSLDRQLTIQCYASAAPDTAQVLIDAADGWVTDSTHFIHILVPLAERHAGMFDSTKYYRAQNDYEQGIAVYGVPYTRIEGVQFYVPPSTTGWGPFPSYPIQLGSNSWNCLIDAVLIDGWYGVQQRHGMHLATAGGSSVRNTIIYGQFDASIALYWQPVTIDNVTIINTGLFGNGSTGIDWSENGNPGHVIRNVYCGGASIACYNGPPQWATMIASASSDATGTIKNVSVASAAFANISGPTINMNIQASSSLKGAGTNLSSAFTNDCAGRTRGVIWDIGACAAQSIGTISPNEKFVRVLYQDLLGRAPTATELQQALNQLASGTLRSTIVQNLFSTAEGSARITSLVQSLVLNNVYQTFLARGPSAGEISFGDAQLHSPLTTVLLNILGSDEYFQRAQSRII